MLKSGKISRLVLKFSCIGLLDVMEPKYVCVAMYIVGTKYEGYCSPQFSNVGDNRIDSCLQFSRRTQEKCEGG